MELQERGSSNKITVIKWCVALLAFGAFIYFFITWVIPVGLLVFIH